MARKQARAILTVLAATILPVAAAPAFAGTGTWTPVGPTQLDRPQVVTHGGSPGMVWVGGSAAGAYQSTDAGTTWSWMGRRLAGLDHLLLAPDPEATAGLWAATASGVFHSVNGGASWSQVSGASYPAALEGDSLAGMLAAGGVLYIRGFNRLLASADQGVTWRVAYSLPPNASVTALGAQASGASGVYLGVYFCCDDGSNVELHRSDDGGNTWAKVPGPWGNFLITAIAVVPGAVFVGAGDSYPGLLRSTDGGSTWEMVLGGSAHDSIQVSGLAADPLAPHALWVVGGSSLAITRDDGATWRRRSLPVAAAFLRADPEAHRLYVLGSAGSNWALYRSADGGASWQEVLSIPSDSSLPPSRVSWRPGDPTRMAMMIGGNVYLSTNAGRSWTWSRVSAGGGDLAVSDLDFDPLSPDRLVGVGPASRVVRSADGGLSWSVAELDDVVELLARTGPRTLLAGGCGIQRSTDRGRTWRNVLPCRSHLATTGRYVQKIEIDPARPDHVYALSFQLADYDPDHGSLSGQPSILWSSADGGLTWKKTAQGLRAFALAEGGSRVYGVRGAALIASDDGGAHWQGVAAAPDGLRDLRTDPSDPATFFATDGDGMLRSRDGGISWERFNRSSLPALYRGGIDWLTLSPFDPQTLYGAWQGGVLHFAFPPAP